MKKTFTINLSGLIFHIDEDAYERLQDYLEKLKRHFGGKTGSDEIITDIESRMAELLQERLGDQKQVVSMADVEHIIAQLGQPFEMETEETAEEPTHANTYSRRSKRLFRDPDRRKIAGVAAGIAAYLSIDALWIRLLFILSLFASGAGLLIYIVLWIVLPEALTTAEKLEMKGEAVNISNLEKAMRKEVNEVSDKFNTYAKGAHESFKKKVPEATNFFDRLIGVLGHVLRALVKIAGVLLGFVLLFLGLGLVTGFVGGLVGLEGFGHLWEAEGFRFSPLLFGDLFFESKSLSSLAGLSISLIVLLPLLLLIYAGLHLLSAGRFRLSHFVLVSITVWFASWLVVVGIGVSTAFDFRHENRHESMLKEFVPASDKPLLIAAADNTTMAKLGESFMLDDERLLMLNQNASQIFDFPRLRFLPSEDSLLRLRLISEARGRSLSKAEDRSLNVDYQPVITDSSLHLPMLYGYPAADLLRGQRVTITMEIPLGEEVFFDSSLYNENLPNHRNYRYFKRYTGKTWVMTPQGLTEVK
ncbi:MAG: PspC domain-containing protein [Bacteroidetes bacterium]|nr:PspC domain-containing protein [Bacteroidota bacterium]